MGLFGEHGKKYSQAVLPQASAALRGPHRSPAEIVLNEIAHNKELKLAGNVSVLRANLALINSIPLSEKMGDLLVSICSLGYFSAADQAVKGVWVEFICRVAPHIFALSHNRIKSYFLLKQMAVLQPAHAEQVLAALGERGREWIKSHEQPINWRRESGEFIVTAPLADMKLLNRAYRTIN